MAQKNILRKQWSLEGDLMFLNHGSFGACPRAVVEEQALLRVEMERNPVRFLWREIEQRLDAARADLAHFVGADPGEIAFVPNATSAVNAVLRSFAFQPGDEIIATDHGYNACNNIATECALRSDAKVIFASIPFPIAGPEQVLAAILGAVTPRTRLVLVDHVTSPTALVLPVAEIIRELEPPCGGCGGSACPDRRGTVPRQRYDPTLGARSWFSSTPSVTAFA